MKLVRRPFGRGPAVSIFTLGTMRAINSSVQMYEVVKAASALDINHLETAPAYGPAERFLGETLKRLKNETQEPTGGWVITSKLLPGLSLQDGQEQLKQILKRLGVPKINNLAVHGLNLPEHLDWCLNGDGAKLLNWAEKEGLVDQIGFSSHGSSSLIKQVLLSGRFQFCSLHLHLLDQERIPLAISALQNGIGVMAISPADKGGQLQNPSKTLLEDCSPITPIELAYRFLLAKGISTLTLGALHPRDLKIAKRLANGDGALNQTEIHALNQLQIQREKRLGKTLCKQCRKCIPCPQNVPIPNLLNLRNLAIGHDLEVFAKQRYNLIGKAGHWWETINASACKRCGECIPLCPSNLQIPDLLEDTHKKLVAPPQKRLWG